MKMLTEIVRVYFTSELDRAKATSRALSWEMGGWASYVLLAMLGGTLQDYFNFWAMLASALTVKVGIADMVARSHRRVLSDYISFPCKVEFDTGIDSEVTLKFKTFSNKPPLVTNIEMN